MVSIRASDFFHDIVAIGGLAAYMISGQLSREDIVAVRLESLSSR